MWSLQWCQCAMLRYVNLIGHCESYHCLTVSVYSLDWLTTGKHVYMQNFSFYNYIYLSQLCHTKIIQTSAFNLLHQFLLPYIHLTITPAILTLYLTLYWSIDIDECQVNNGNCSDNCTNTIGGYECQCNPGFELMNDSSTCVGKERHNKCFKTCGMCI